MRAILVSEPNKFEIAEIPRPICRDGEVLIRTAYCGICGTDLKILNGSMHRNHVRYPLVPGHEWSGTVVEIGPGVREWAIGDRVIAEGYLPCGRCHYCKKGKVHLCESHEQIGFTRDGALAEYVLVPAQSCHRVPCHITLDEALLVEPAATVLRGIDAVPFVPGCNVAVVGCGPMGQIAIRLLLLRRPSTIVAIDVSGHQRAPALRAGATDFMSTESLKAHTSGNQRWDAVINCAPGADAMQAALQIVSPGGHVLFIGSAPHGETLSFPAQLLVSKDLTLVGIRGYTRQSWSRTLDLLSRGQVKLADLISHRTTLANFQEAIDLIRSQGISRGKIIVSYS
jgi:L-iditol 2-dehydrogenase